MQSNRLENNLGSSILDMRFHFVKAKFWNFHDRQGGVLSKVTEEEGSKGFLN